MTLNRVKANLSQERLMIAIGEAIRLHTMVSPMTLEDIVGVLGFTTGAAIARADRRLSKSELRQMAVANIDHGLQAALSAPPPILEATANLVLPN